MGHTFFFLQYPGQRLQVNPNRILHLLHDMMLSKQLSSKLQADLYGILAMEDEREARILETSSVKVPLPVESVPLPQVRVAMSTSGDLNTTSTRRCISLMHPNSATPSPRFRLKKWRHDGGQLQTSPSRAEPTTPNFILTCDPPSVDFDTDVIAASSDRPPPEEFKCGALCLFLTGFGKVKAVRAKKPDSDNGADRVMISRTVSLEKFECGSWASSVEEIARGSTANLPLELLRTSGNDTISPVAAAFVFDRARKSVQESSSRHVRFSTSSPRLGPTSPGGSYISPRLRSA